MLDDPPPGLALRRVGAAARLVLDRPDKRNAISEAMWRALPDVVRAVAADEPATALRVEGAGAHFSGGADIAEFPEVYGSAERVTRYNATVKAGVAALASCPKPVLAVVRGVCFGGGVSLALACDLRFAARDARFAVVPAKLGLIYNHADTKRLVDAVGASRAKDLLFTGRAVGADEALDIGLVDHVAESAELDALVEERLAAMTAASRAAIAATKRMVAAVAAGADAETDELAALFNERFASHDFAEGYAAFLAKRPPRFTER
jgi:enoyl-CoA hydratase/carnithine racemase